jgi:O-antigen/teichoic acid export membrane protein
MAIGAEKTAPAMTGRGIISGAAWTASSYLLPQAYTLIASVIGARILGPNAMGQQSFIAWAELALAFLVSQGLSVSLVRHIGDAMGRGNPQAVRSLLKWAWHAGAAGASLAGASLFLVGFSQPHLRAAWVLGGIVCAAVAGQAIPNAVLIGMQRWRDAALVGLVVGALATVGTAAALGSGLGITGIFAVQAAAWTAGLIWSWHLARRALGTLPAATSPTPIGPLARFAGVASIDVILTLVVWRRSELLFLNIYGAPAQIALYSISFAAVSALLGLPQAIAAVVLPTASRLFGAGADERIRTGFSRALRLQTLTLMPISAAAVALGPETLRLLYGDAYRGTGLILVIMMAAFPLIPLSSLAGSLFWALGRLRFVIAIGLVAAALNVGLDFVFIPAQGAIGAALAKVGAQVTSSSLGLFLAWRCLREVRWESRSLLRAGLVSVGAGIAAYIPVYLLAGVAGIGVGLLAGVLTGALLAVSLRPLPTNDAIWLSASAGHRAGGLLRRACLRLSGGGESSGATTGWVSR